MQMLNIILKLTYTLSLNFSLYTNFLQKALMLLELSVGMYQYNYFSIACNNTALEFLIMVYHHNKLPQHSAPLIEYQREEARHWLSGCFVRVPVFM